MFLVNSRRPQSLQVFLSHFTFKLRQSWFAFHCFSSYPGIKIPRELHSFMVSSGISLTIHGVCLCCSGSSGMAFAPYRCPLSSQIPMFPSSPWFYGLCCFLLWHFFVTTRESPLGQLAFSLFQLIYEAILGDRKTSLFCSWERCSGVASIFCNPYDPTSTSTVL